VNNGRNLQIQRANVLCISDEDREEEICSFTEESQLQRVRGRPLFIFVVNLGPRNHRFTLTAEWEPARPALCRAELCLPLKNNEAVTKTIEANSFRFTHEGKPGRLMTFTVPAQALAVALRVRAANPQANVDAFVGRGGLGPEENPEAMAHFGLVSSLGEEMLILPRPTAGSYWLTVLNRTNEPQAVEVIVTVLMDLQDLNPGTPTGGQIGGGGGLLPFLALYLRTSQGVLAPTQYRLSLKAADLQGVVALQLSLQGAGAPNLHVRLDQVVEIRDGLIQADLQAVGPATVKTINLTGKLLKPGQIYLAVEGLGALPQNYELQAQLIKARTAVFQTVRVVLEPVWVRVGDGR
jgi:hypothetical protein